MTKVKTSKDNYSENEVKRYLGALHEEHLDALKVIREGHGIIQTQLNNINAKLEEQDEKLDSHTQMIGQIMTDVTEIKGELKQKVDYADFAKLERRVGKLELKLNR